MHKLSQVDVSRCPGCNNRGRPLKPRNCNSPHPHPLLSLPIKAPFLSFSTARERERKERGWSVLCAWP